MKLPWSTWASWSFGDDTRQQLLDHAKGEGDLNWNDESAAGTRIGEMLALVGATTEYQFG